MAQERGQPTPGRGHSPSHREPRVGGRGHTVGGELRSSPDPARKHLQPQVLREPCAESRRNLHGHREVPAPPHGPARWHCPEATSQRGTGPGEVPQPARDHAASGVGEVGTRASSSPNSAEDMLLRNLPPLSWRRGAGPPADAGNQTPGRSRRSTASGGRGAASAAGLPAKPRPRQARGPGGGGFTPRQRHGEAICPPTCLPATGTDSPRGPGAPLLGFHGAGHSAEPSALSDGPPTVQTGRRGQNPAASPADTCAQGVGCDCTRSPCQTPRLRTPAGQEPESGLSGNGALGMDGVETSRSLSRCPSGALS